MSEDKINKVFSVDLMARFIVLTEAVENKLLNKGGRVMNVLASTQAAPHPNMETMQSLLEGVKTDGSVIEIMSTASVTADAFLQGASSRYPDYAFIGTHPGLVHTEVTKATIPKWISDILFKVAQYAGVLLTEEECGFIHTNILASPNAKKRPVTYFNSFYDGREAIPIAYEQIYIDWFWKFAVDFVKNHK